MSLVMYLVLSLFKAEVRHKSKFLACNVCCVAGRCGHFFEFNELDEGRKPYCRKGLVNKRGKGCR